VILADSAPSGIDSLVDVPTNGAQTDTGVGGEVRGNYCVLNALTGLGTLANGNLDFTGSAGGVQRFGTIGVSSGKWYWEVTVTSGTGGDLPLLGIGKNPNQSGLVDVFGYYGFNGNKYQDSTATSYGAAYGINDVIGIAFDADNGTLTFYKNNTSQGQAYSGISGTYFPYMRCAGSAIVANFGQRAFAYTAPSGFKALNTANLPAPLVTKPNTVMDVKLYTGNGSTQTISGLGFSPDFVWLKARSAAYNHELYDTVRGALQYLSSSTTNAESTLANSLTAFGSDGFSVGSQVGSNGSGTTFAAWTWDAGSSTVTNTQGSISSQVRANASAGFSVVTYTGNLTGAGNATIGHGLGVAPALVITKSRSNSSRWAVQHLSLGSDDYLELNTTAAVADSVSVGAGALPKPTSTVFYGSWLTGLNISGQTFVAYCFAPVVGYSSMGSYVANANSNGPFVYTGFKPRFVLCKLSSAAGADWLIFDTARSPYNVVQANLRPNTSGAEESAFARIDILSNGFKVRAGSGVEPNSTNGNTYIYAAWAESPFNYSRAA